MARQPEGMRDVSDFQDITSAPRDGTSIQARIPGHGDDNIIMWLVDTVEGENGPCGCWVFANEDQEPPEDWSDGYCWAMNEDGERSTWPTHWKPARPNPQDERGRE